MRRRHAFTAILPFLLACQAMASSVRAPVEGEGELYVYLQPLNADNRNVKAWFDRMAARPSASA